MQDRFKFRVAEFTDKDHFIQFSYYELGDVIYGTLCGHNSEPQMCTGLKDKNGKLIYEADIVKQGDDKYVVNWLEGTFCFKKLKTLHNFTIEYVMPSKQEVIGNIYENPELLESEEL